MGGSASVKSQTTLRDNSFSGKRNERATSFTTPADSKKYDGPSLELDFCNVTYIPASLQKWMEIDAFFNATGIRPLTARLKEGLERAILKGTEVGVHPVKELVDLFAAWDEISFFSLVQHLNPLFCTEDALEFVRGDGSIVQSSIDGKDMPPALKSSQRKIGELIQHVMMMRESERLHGSGKGKGAKLKFRPSKVLGDSIREVNLDIFEDTELYGKVSNDLNELQGKYHDLVALCRELYISRQSTQDEMQIMRSSHDHDVQEAKERAEQDFRAKLKAVDEMYLDNIHKLQAANKYLIDKYSKARLKYKRVKNRFIHAETQLGQFINKTGGKGATTDQKKSMIARSETNVKARAADAGPDDGENDGNVSIDDFMNLNSDSTPEEMQNAKDAVKAILNSRENAIAADRAKFLKIQELQDQREDERKELEGKIAKLRKDNLEFSQKILLMTSRLREQGQSEFVKKLSSTAATKVLVVNRDSKGFGKLVNMISGRERKDSRMYKSVFRWMKLCMRRRKLVIKNLQSQLKLSQMDTSATNKTVSDALAKSKEQQESYIKEYEKAIEAKWAKRVAILEGQLKNASTSQENNESESAAAIAAKTHEFEEERKIMQMKMDKLQADAQREHKMLETLTKDSKEQNRLLKKEISDLAAKNEKLAAKVTMAEGASKHVDKLREEVKRAKEMKKILEGRVKQCQEQVDLTRETYVEEREKRIRYHNILEDMKGKIRVYCRIRPLSGSEKKRKDSISATPSDKYTISVVKDTGRDREKTFSYDEVYGPSSTQQQVYANTSHLIQSAYDGYNVCIFAYGQTGTGKTYTMYGSDENPGVAPRAIQSLYKLVEKGRQTGKVEVSCYMVELYKAKLQDLLCDEKNRGKNKLKVTKDRRGIVEVRGAEIKLAPKEKDLFAIMQQGNENRKVSSTLMNAGSSRSHLILSVLIKKQGKKGKATFGKLSLVDLAGCERASKTGATAEQMKEAQSINQSLSALGNVIAALSSGSKHVPYRSHVLTNLMSDSLGGNAKTLMFVNVSPSGYNTDETINALNYATRVKMVKNSADKNSESNSKALEERDEEIARLKAEIKALKSK